MTGRKYLSKLCFTSDPFELGFGQGGTSKIGFPQSASFPKNDLAVKFVKGPLDGISPDSLLKDTFKYFRYESVSRAFGITPNKSLQERSKISNPFKSPKDYEISPWNEFFDKLRLFRLSKAPMVLGIFPVIWFRDKSMRSIASKNIHQGNSMIGPKTIDSQGSINLMVWVFPAY